MEQKNGLSGTCVSRRVEPTTEPVQLRMPYIYRNRIDRTEWEKGYGEVKKMENNRIISSQSTNNINGATGSARSDQPVPVQ